MNAHLIDYWRTFIIYVCAEVKFFLPKGVQTMGPAEIFPELGDWNIEIEGVVLVEDSCHEMNKKAVGRVLICCELNLHSPELHSPADIVVDGYFKAN